MDDREFEILSAKVREIYESGRVPEPGSVEAEIVKRYDNYLKNKRSELSGIIPKDIQGEVPSGMNDVIKREYILSVRKMLEEGRTPEPGSIEAKILANFDAILKNEQSELSDFLSKKGSDEIVLTQTPYDDTLETLPSSNMHVDLEKKTTSNKQIYKPSLIERIRAGLAGVKDKVDRTVQREFRYRQFRRFKD